MKIIKPREELRPRYRQKWFKILLTVSFQFHHTQMDGAHAARFLNCLQEEISAIRNL